MVCEMDKARQETCPIAVAFVSAHKLLNDKSGNVTRNLLDPLYVQKRGLCYNRKSTFDYSLGIICPDLTFVPSLCGLACDQSSALADAEDGKWYKLHDFENETDGRPRVFGAVRLKLQGADSDGRRTLYHQPLFPQGSISVPLPGIPAGHFCT